VPPPSAEFNSLFCILTSSGKQGPIAWYGDGGAPIGNLGSDYADMQFDPLTCGFWAVGALVGDPGGEHTAPVERSVRATWVTEIQVDCNNAEMNGDGVVNEADLALYLEYYSLEDQRADMDRSGTITTRDYLLYSDEYAKR
jgi:hypothetical protein